MAKMRILILCKRSKFESAAWSSPSLMPLFSASFSSATEVATTLKVGEDTGRALWRDVGVAVQSCGRWGLASRILVGEAAGAMVVEEDDTLDVEEGWLTGCEKILQKAERSLLWRAPSRRPTFRQMNTNRLIRTRTGMAKDPKVVASSQKIES